MKAVSGWSYRPYTQMHEPERALKPYIARLAPGETHVRAEFIDFGYETGEYFVHIRKRGEAEERVLALGKNKKVDIGDLSADTDYELFVERADGVRSDIRLARTGCVPGCVINYLHPEDEQYAFSGRYLCSPSLIRLPSGKLLASMDVFASSMPQNLTLIFESNDNGENWEYVTELFPCFWGKMFLSSGRLYMLSVSREYGDLLIGRSDDEGKTWTKPTVLFRGSSSTRETGIHRAPMPVIHANGRVITDVQYGAWPKRIMADAVLSAPEGSDLTNAENWVLSEFWKPSDAPEAVMENVIGGIEGSMVAAPDGSICDFLRYANGKWLMLEYDPGTPEGRLTFKKIVDFPATTSKADILYDEKSGYYISIASYWLKDPETNRNLLSLLYSKDLENWRLAEHLIDFRGEDPHEVGFQYVSFLIDGEDILYQCRTAFNRAHNFHDSNYQTFHRVKAFRSLLK